VSRLLSGLGSVTVLIVGIVTGLFILLFLMKDWRLVTDGTADHIALLLGLPDRVGRQIMSDTVHSFRSYAWGLTIVGLMNGHRGRAGRGPTRGPLGRTDRHRDLYDQLHPVLRGPSSPAPSQC
jgi:hypothetical protein